MNKMINITLMVTGIVFLGIISIIYSFSTIEIPTVVYMVLWLFCIGIIRIAAGPDYGVEG